MAFVLASDCPVRLIDWSPALPISGVWDAATKTARMSFTVKGPSAEIKWACRTKIANVKVSGKPVAYKVVSKRGDWVEYSVKIGNGTKTMTITVTVQK